MPIYTDASWKGYVLNNPQIYLGWVTPEEHPAIQAAVATYKGVVSPHVDGKSGEGGVLTKEPRVERWIFSTDGVGFPVPKDDTAFRAPRTSTGSCPAPTSTRRCSASAPASSRTPTRSASASTCASCSTLAFLARFPSVFAGAK